MAQPMLLVEAQTTWGEQKANINQAIRTLSHRTRDSFILMLCHSSSKQLDCHLSSYLSEVPSRFREARSGVVVLADLMMHISWLIVHLY